MSSLSGGTPGASVGLAGDLRCVQCGAEAQHLYQVYEHFKPPIIKITHCEMCGEPVDKYIECDSVLVTLDVLLHRPPAYRHILHNTQHSTAWKLLLLLLLYDAYLKLSALHLIPPSTDHIHQIICAAFEANLYKVLFISALEWATLNITLALLMTLHDPLSSNTASYLKMGLALVVGSFGKVLTLVSVVWTPTWVLLHLTTALIFTSQLTALSVACCVSYMRAGLWLLCAYSLRYIISECLLSVLF